MSSNKDELLVSLDIETIVKGAQPTFYERVKDKVDDWNDADVEISRLDLRQTPAYDLALAYLANVDETRAKTFLDALHFTLVHLQLQEQIAPEDGTTYTITNHPINGLFGYVTYSGENRNIRSQITQQGNSIECSVQTLDSLKERGRKLRRKAKVDAQQRAFLDYVSKNTTNNDTLNTIAAILYVNRINAVSRQNIHFKRDIITLAGFSDHHGLPEMFYTMKPDFSRSPLRQGLFTPTGRYLA